MQMKKAFFCFFLFAYAILVACSGEENEISATDSKQDTVLDINKSESETVNIDVPVAEKSPGATTGDSVVTGESLSDKEADLEDVSKAPNRKKNDITRTIMIYMVGSDLESQYGAGSYDIMEIMDSGIDLNKNNVLLYTGGTQEWWLTAIPSNRNVIYELKEDGFSLVEKQLSLNMGDSYTLERFLKYGKEKYPADQFGLILWDHGGGPMLGYGLDEKTSDILEMPELVEALDNSGFEGTNKLEFLGFDACLMGAVETGWNIKDNAKYMIASQETEPGWGWNYAFLSELRYCEDGEDIGKEIIDYYIEAGEEYFEEEPLLLTDLTLSCVDLSKITVLENAINEMYAEVVPDLDAGYFAKASRARNKTKTFGKFTASTSYDLVDLGDMVSFFASDYGEEAEALKKALEEFVCYSKTNVADAAGVSIFYPYENRDYMTYWVEMYEDFDFAPNYTKYLKEFTKLLKKPRSSAWSTMRGIQGNAVKMEDANLMTFQLTPELMEDYAYSQYVILRKVGDNEYLYVINSNDTEIDDTGLISASYNNRMVFAVNNLTGEWSELPMPMFQVTDGTSKDRYTLNAVLFGMPEVDSVFSDVSVGEIQFVLGEIPEMFGIRPLAEEDNLFPAKKLLDYREFSSIEFGVELREPARTENGELLPFREWGKSSRIQGTSLSVSEGFHFEYQDISSDEEYYYMFQVYDLQGNCSVSELFPLPTAETSVGEIAENRESLMETELADYDNLIQGVTVKSVEEFRAETLIELSEKPEDYTFRMDGYTYELPMPLSYLTETGWIFYSWCNFDEITLGPGMYKKAYMHKDGKTLEIEVFNPAGDNKKFKECVVGRISFEFPMESELVLAQETVANALKIDEVMTLLGNPNFVEVETDGKHIALEYYFDYADVLKTNFTCYEMSFSVDTKQLVSLVMANYKEEEAVDSNADTEYLQDYDAPEVLGDDLLSWNVQLMGDVYTLPAPVSAFTENGWEIILAQSVKAGSDLDQGIIMQKDGVVVGFSVFNFSDYQTNAADATVYKLSQMGDATGTWRDMQLVLPGNISIGMTEDVFLNILEKNAAVKEAFSVDVYEGYFGGVTNTYEYADSFDAKLRLRFVDGVLNEITIFNEKCKYRDE